MRRVAALAAIGLVLACLAPACGRKTRPGIPARNLVLVTIEGARADHFGAYLFDRPTSSLASDDGARKEGRAMGIDDLAASGVVFAHAFAPSPRTVPSLASLFTSRSPLECGVTADDEGVPDDVATLAELFDAAGFRTAAFVTATDLDLEGAFGRGFGTFATARDDASTLAAATAFAKHDQGDGSRRFVWIHLLGPQAVWDGAASIGSAETEERLAQRDFGALPEPGELERFASGKACPDAAQAARVANAYDRELARATIGLSLALRDAFDYYETNADASETWARTAFVLTSPCGSLLGEDGAVGHAGTLHDAVLRVPLVLRHPDSLTGERVIADAVELADILPTLVEWFDLPTPARVQGRSLLARLDSWRERPFPPRPVITALPARVFSARTGRFHLVWNPLGGKPEDRLACAPPIAPLALYEPDRDPSERDDVAAEHPDVVSELQDAVKAWRDAQEVHPPQTRRPLGEPRRE